MVKMNADPTKNIQPYSNAKKRTSVAHYGVTESHQYELDESEVWRHHQLQRFVRYMNLNEPHIRFTSH